MKVNQAAAIYEIEVPHIAPVPIRIERPMWSVMIPTFNSALYLRQTLESVLAQDPGPKQMQIEVVDDCSTKDDPESVVNEVGRGRVAFYRKPRNQGAIENFNTCIERSRGELVHILHGDDTVRPGFYDWISQAAAQWPALSLYATRCFFVDHEGIILGPSHRVTSLEHPANDVEQFFYSTPIQPPAVVVRRATYEHIGGFRPNLPHTADRDMWIRAIDAGGGVVSSHVLADYRVHADNDTSKLRTSGANLLDVERLNAILGMKFPSFNVSRGIQCICRDAYDQARRFEELGDGEAARENWRIWRSRASPKEKVRVLLINIVRKVWG